MNVHCLSNIDWGIGNNFFKGLEFRACKENKIDKGEKGMQPFIGHS